jgi:hypothetical protein
LVFERKILRRIFGPTKGRYGTWRIKTNDKLKKLITIKTIINYIKSQRLGWFGHVQGGSNMTGTNCDLFTHKSSRLYLNHLVYRMPDERMVKKRYMNENPWQKDH